MPDATHSAQRLRTPMMALAAIGLAGMGLVAPRWFASGSTAAPNIDLAPILMRLSVATAAVLSICALATRALAKRGGGSQNNLPGEFELVETLPIHGLCRVQLVRVGDQWLLAGCDAGGIKSVIHLPADAAESLMVEATGLQRAA